MNSNYNVLKVSEIHAFEESNKRARKNYRDEISDQVNSYISEYNIDEIWILGDTGSFDDVFQILDGIDDKVEVKLVAGDEDKDSKKVNGNDYTGWFRQINHEEPFDVSVPYQIFDEGFETKIKGYQIQASHHPNSKDREEELNHPDKRDSKFLDNLFSVKRDTNRNTVEMLPPSLEGADVFIYDHVHMPYTRIIGNKLLEGLGGRRFNYQREGDCLPERSIHISSFEDDLIHKLHFDAEYDDIFEHLVFDSSEEEIFDVKDTRDSNRKSGYYPIQSRFKNNQIRRKSWEKDDQIPDFWN